MSGVGTAIAIGGGLAAAGGIGSAAIEANAQGNAASTEANAADQAAQMQGELGQESLQNEEYQFQQAQANDQPWLQSGANSLASLDYLLGVGGTGGTVGSNTTGPGQTLSIPGVAGSVSLPGVQGLEGTANTNLGAYGSLMQGYQGGQFQAPTAAQAEASPGEEFALQQGEGAVQAGASANGSLLTGGTLNAENQFGQNLASTNYNNVYNQALQTYNTNYNTWAAQQAAKYNMLAGQSGLGQTTATQLGTQGLTSAGQVANTLTNTGQQMGSDYMNAAQATASGYIGAGNAWGQGLNAAGGALSQMQMLQMLLNQQGQGAGYGGYGPIVPGLGNTGQGTPFSGGGDY